ncbi:MAG: FAD-dependent oxidoreductase [Dehalococcoidia bacterium]|nr:FAD-dependent oxidoreductase [Dehalococcoidia bacterium]
MAKIYDVVIVGGGPAGIFTALELAKSSDLRVLILEKGPALNKRCCPSVIDNTDCLSCSPCDMVSGWGGAGAFSDGKLTLSSDVGGRLTDYQGVENTEALIRYVDRCYLRFGAPEVLHGIGPEVEGLKQKAKLAGLNLIPVPVRHLGTERCYGVLQRMQGFLADRVEMQTDITAESILIRNGRARGIESRDGQRIEARHVVVAPGREGSDWLVKEAFRLKLTKHNNPIDIGLRVEVPNAVLAELTDALYECKLEFYSRTFKDRIRTFCMCPAGEVTMESTGGADPVITVNGHSYAHRKTANTNFALLGSASFAEPFHDPITYGRSVARLANLLSGGAILQRLGDLKKGRSSASENVHQWKVQPTLRAAAPGDISAALPYRFLKGINEMLTAMDKLAPGVASPHTLLYGIEVKFYSSRLQLTQNLETEVPNLYAIGDGAGVSRGLVQASASGVIAAREILRRTGKGTRSS